MTRRTIGALGCGLITAAVLLAPAIARSREDSRPPVAAEPAIIAMDSGPGERLRVVIGGVYATEGEALEANAKFAFGDVAGYYVVPTAQFLGLDAQLGTSGAYVLASVFRTDVGAQDFVDLAASFGAPALLVPERVRSLGGVYAGLGQEPDPRGRGPLSAPVPASQP